MTYKEFKEKLSGLKSWQLMYREIMLLGKSLPEMPELLKTDDVLIKGCESKVWLRVELSDDQILVLIGDSDTRIVKGLMGIIMLMHQGTTPEQSLSINTYDEFEQLGLIKHLSPSRGNGIKAIADTIQEKVKQWL
jgi:cysteine desulfuration protein SufE